MGANIRSNSGGNSPAWDANRSNNHVENAHGGNLYEVAREYGFEQKDLADFSANINPLGISRRLKELLAEGIDELVNYPDMECNELRDELSKYHGVAKDRIITGNGASEIIRLLFDVLKPMRLFMPAPCFSEYEIAAKSCGSEILYAELREEDEFRLDIESFIWEIPVDADTIMICNPNNPTSKLVSRCDLLKLVGHAYMKNIRVIVDEAFIELTAGGNDNSVAGWLGQFPNLFIIRSLTKILAVPGLRLGYALGEYSAIQGMWQKKIKWSVNSLACKIGSVLNEDKAFFEATSNWLSVEKERLYNGLAGIRKLKVFKPDTNFILIRILDDRVTSVSLRELLIRKGFIIRDASNFKFLDDRFVRVAVKDRESNDCLVAALSEILC